jgi:hypothetical protein
MIAKQDILDRVTEWRLRPDVIEKDYVLVWSSQPLPLTDRGDGLAGCTRRSRRSCDFDPGVAPGRITNFQSDAHQGYNQPR